MRALVVALVIVFAAGTARAQQPPSAQLSLERRDVHAGVPFTLSMVIDGFEETPQPTLPKLEIPGAKVTPMGATPQVRESISIINGRQTRDRSVRWVLKWSVELAKAGRVRIGPVTAVQGSRRAVAAAGDVEVSEVETTPDMKFELVLPERPVFVGETIEVKLVWTLGREPENPQFAVPLAQSDDFIVTAMPAAQGQRTLALSVGGKELPVPFDVDQVTVGGRELSRITMRLLAAPKKAGKITLPGASVVVGLPVGRPDFFGRSATKMFKASDTPKTIEVKPLPETDKPPSFAGAVGTQFSISVDTSRSVVQLGEPVELAVTIKSNQRLDTLSLPRLDGPGGLPKDKFTVGADVPTGELADEGKTKTFKVTAQVTGPATEIPALAFSYFDPVKSQYQTIHSDPIAVSVKGGSIVGAGDVVAVAPTKKPGGGTAMQPDADIALVGAELALSSPAAATKQPLAGTLLWLLVALLYAVPLVVLVVRTWQIRTQGQREEAAEVRAARQKVEAELARSAKEPARDTAGSLVAALRAFARTVDRDPNDDGGLFAKIETESFAPGASESPLSADLRGRADDLVRRWTGEAARKRSTKPVAAASMLLVLAFAPQAEAAGEQALEAGRKAYQEAMATTDASARKAAFARAATALGEAAAAMPDRPELLADWGNAALGAGDVGTATLAYRRALALDASNARAQRNLAWLRSRQSDQLRPANADAADALFFFHSWPRSRRMLVGAGAFAIAILLLVPWAGRRRRALTGAALLPAAIWLAMLVSLFVEDRHTDDAVVMDSVIVRAADSSGAPAALSTALPRGTEVTLLERRDSWAKIRLANGTAGWVPDGAVTRIHAP